MIRRHRILLLVSLSSCLLAQATIEKASPIVSALQDKNYERALKLLRPALASHPANAQLWAMQGSAYIGEGKNKEALMSFRRALRISPDDLPALQGAAQIEYEAGSPAAIPLIEHVMRMRPADLTSHGMLAVLYYQLGNYAGAVEQFEMAGTLFDSQPGALHAYAVCLVKVKRFDEAAKTIQRTLALDPGSESERQLLASVQVMANQPTAALATLAPLLKTGTPNAGTLELASSAYEEAKDTTQAVGSIKQAILLDPRNVNLYLDFANISYAHGSFQVGIEVINDGMALQPKAAPLYFARGVLYVQLTQYDKAEEDFEKAYELDPSQSLSAAAQGLTAAQANDFDRALLKVKASLARNQNDPLLLYLQAEILAQSHSDSSAPGFRLAVRSAQRAIALQPTLGAAHGVLAKLYLQSGNYQEAAVECRKALASNPADQAAVYHLIQALRKREETQEIPNLLKRLAVLRQEAEKNERDRYRFKLIEGDTPPQALN
ncbi:MAG TPA: tetratricopeptide repeat protein [Acidisarcina sp.]